MMEPPRDINSLLSALAFYVWLGVSSYSLFYLTYQIFLHPLRRYPGPLTAKLSDAYNGFYAFKKRLHLRTWQNHLKYGSVVRQGPNKLVFNSITALRDIYKTDWTTKPKAYVALGPGLTTPTTITAIDRQVHRSRRQLVGQVVSERFMRMFEPIMLEQVDLFTRQILISARKSVPVNITEYSRRLTLNIAGLLAFGHDLGLQTSEENRFMLTILEAGPWWSNIFLHWPNARRFRLGLVTVRVFQQLRGKYLSVVEAMITSRTKQGKDAQHDLYEVVADALDSGSASGLRRSELWAEANLFLTAAGDTTKTAISAVFFYLSRNPHSYERLAREVRSTFKAGNEIRGSALTGCHYLRACIDEALRMSPPAAGILWREPFPSNKPFVVDGQVIPQGTIVGVNIYSIHHNEEYFPEPFAFRPERWLDDDTIALEKRMTRDAFAPFSLGPRGCAGKPMAYLEVSLVVAKTIWYFDFRPTSGSLGGVGAGVPGAADGRERPEEFQLFDVFTAGHDGPYLEFRCREDVCKDFDDVAL